MTGISLSLSFALLSSLFVAALYFFLYLQEKDRPLRIWAAGWGLYSMRFALQLAVIHNLLPPGAIVIQQTVSVVCGLLFLWGTEQFIGKKMSRIWPVLAGCAILWTVIGFLKSFSFAPLHAPGAFFIGACFLLSGARFLSRPHRTATRLFTGISLVLWGLHKSNYPFLRTVEWFAPWGFMLASLLFFMSAVGVILVYYEKHRLDMMQEMTKRQDSEKRFRSIVETTIDGIILASEDGVIIFANSGAAAMFGYERGYFAGKKVSTLMPERYRTDHTRGLERIKQTRKSSYLARPLSFHGLRKDGSEFPLDLNVSHWISGDKNYFSGILRDTSAIRETENKLASNNALLNAIIEGSSDAIFAKDRQGRYIIANEATIGIIGSPKEKILGNRDDALFPPELAGQIEEVDAIVMETGKPELFEEEILTPSGRAIFLTSKSPLFDSSGQITGIIGIARDITERVHQVKKIEEGKQLLHDVFTSIQDGISVLDSELTIIQVNPTMDTLFPAKLPLVGRKCHEAYQNRNTPCINCPATRALKSGRLEWGEVPRLSPDGPTGTLELYAYPMLDEHGEIKGIVEYLRDITEAKKQAEEHRKLELQLRQAQKMEAIGTLAGGIAHDFNNILVPILCFTELLLAQEPPDSPKKADLQEIFKASQRAKELVKQILTFSRQTDHDRAPLLVTPVIKECIKLLRASIPKTIKICANIKTDYAVVLADPTHIHQIMMNLATNAYHAMQSRGVLTINLEEVTVSLENMSKTSLTLFPGRYIRLQVKDTGCGMERPTVLRIFDPYFTTKKQGEGTGLGLSVVHGIVRNYDGEITVRSAPGVGTSFTVHLPLYEDKNEQPETETPDDAPVRGNGEHILLVDDEQALLQSVHRMLETQGYKVTAATSGQEAFDTFKKDPESFQLIITDQTMPGLTGDRLAAMLLQNRPALPIILCTGFSEIIDEEKAKQLGIRGFLPKPFIKKDLAEIVHRVLAEKNLQND
ncbi:MAG: PAS domain S-box protein [Pseudomonadota bacterium]